MKDIIIKAILKMAFAQQGAPWASRENHSQGSMLSAAATEYKPSNTSKRAGRHKRKPCRDEVNGYAYPLKIPDHKSGMPLGNNSPWGDTQKEEWHSGKNGRGCNNRGNR